MRMILYANGEGMQQKTTGSGKINCIGIKICKKVLTTQTLMCIIYVKQREQICIEAGLGPLFQKNYVRMILLGNKNHVALITGANRGVGRGVAFVFAEKGYDIFLAHCGEPEKAQEVAKIIKEKYGRRCVTCDCNLAKAEEIERTVCKAEETFGIIDVLMSNAGVGYERYISYAKVEEIDHVYLVNYRAGILLAKRVAQHMIAHNIKGSIIFTASIKSIQPTAIDCIYGGLKAGLKRSAQSLALEYAPYGIRVNTVSPGCIAINPVGYEDRDYADQKKVIPVGRTGVGEDIGYAAAFLASQEASFITGIDILVDGGAACGVCKRSEVEAYDGVNGRGTFVLR